MLVREVMTSPAVTVSPYTTTCEALRLLAEYGITALPTVDDDGTVLGLVGEADLLAAMSDSADPEQPVVEALRVGQVMSRPATVVSADSTVADAVSIMTSAAVKSLPVVLHDRIVGIVSRSDLVRMLAHADDHIRYEVTGRLRAAGRDWIVDVNDHVVTISGPVTDEQRNDAQQLARTVCGIASVRYR